eukprot:TRINITY_DN790_c0_g1_i13.p6 TRINITY_DN790_c0_g1~~TRINITY_DN790_c0_g1_i13.p6  ORF type:complete len:115 (-),score=5.27 TRINITY_DN790_c0_g1_i13:1446-1790(-)
MQCPHAHGSSPRHVLEAPQGSSTVLWLWCEAGRGAEASRAEDTWSWEATESTTGRQAPGRRASRVHGVPPVGAEVPQLPSGARVSCDTTDGTRELERGTQCVRQNVVSWLRTED